MDSSGPEAISDEVLGPSSAAGGLNRKTMAQTAGGENSGSGLHKASFLEKSHFDVVAIS